MKVKIDSQLTGLVVGAVVPVTDFNSTIQKLNAEGNKVFRVPVIFKTDDIRKEISVVNIAASVAPIVTEGSHVSFKNLCMQTWALNGKNGVSYSADSVSVVGK